MLFSGCLHKSFQIPLKQLKLELIWKHIKADFHNQHTVCHKHLMIFCQLFYHCNLLSQKWKRYSPQNSASICSLPAYQKVEFEVRIHKYWILHFVMTGQVYDTMNRWRKGTLNRELPWCLLCSHSYEKLASWQLSNYGVPYSTFCRSCV